MEDYKEKFGDPSSNRDDSVPTAEEATPTTTGKYGVSSGIHALGESDLVP